MADDMIRCPLIDDMLEIGDCVVYSDVASGMLNENCIPDEFRQKEKWRDICNACKYHEM